MEAQEIEKQVLSMSQWMTEISKEIQNRLDADVLAGDVPEEHEVSDISDTVSRSRSNYEVRGHMYIICDCSISLEPLVLF